MLEVALTGPSALTHLCLSGQSYAMASSIDYHTIGGDRPVDEAWRSQLSDLVQSRSDSATADAAAAAPAGTTRPSKFKAAAIAVRAATSLQRSAVHASPPRLEQQNSSTAPNSTSPIKGYAVQTIRSKGPDTAQKQFSRMVSAHDRPTSIATHALIVVEAPRYDDEQAMSVRELQSATAGYSQHSLTQLKERKARQVSSAFSRFSCCALFAVAHIQCPVAGLVPLHVVEHRTARSRSISGISAAARSCC